MIQIGKPYLQSNGNEYTRLISNIIVDGKSKIVWAEVENKYKDYLCYERSDAFVLGLLHYAMLNKHDIICEAPMGEDLYYQITNYFIDAISKGSNSNMYHVKIIADIDQNTLPCANKVCTGISCGVDSLHVLAHLKDNNLKNHRITHLAFNNVGSNGFGEQSQILYKQRIKIAEKFCKEYGFELTSVNSNIMDSFKQNHFMTCIYTCCFSIYVLQKLYSIYYIASSEPIFNFNLKNNHLKDASYYEYLLTTTCSTNNLRIYCEGMTKSRLEKVQDIIDYLPSHKYLNVCTMKAENCNICEKCTRTLLALDILGALEKYKNVFDIDYYIANKQKYLTKMFIQRIIRKDTEYTELYNILKKQIKFYTYIRIIPLAIGTFIYDRVKNEKINRIAEYLYIHFFK